MTRIRIGFLTSVAIALAAATISAGGWAVITVDALPDRIEAGRAVTFAFTVRQHGHNPLGGLTARVEAGAGSQRISANANAGRNAGQYIASLTFPRAGDWSITVHSGFMTSKLTLLPLTVVDAGGPLQASVSATEKGRQLFVAKGCVTCHVSDVTSPNESLKLAPALIPKKYQDEFLARILANPAATLPTPRDAAQMPNLGLDQPEIAALVAFINDGSRPYTNTTAEKQR